MRSRDYHLRAISRDTLPLITKTNLKIVYLKISFKSPRGEWVNVPLISLLQVSNPWCWRHSDRWHFSWLGYHLFSSLFLYSRFYIMVMSHEGHRVAIDPSHKSQGTLNKYPTMHHFVTEMCTFLLQNGASWAVGLVYCGICETNVVISEG